MSSRAEGYEHVSRTSQSNQGFPTNPLGMPVFIPGYSHQRFPSLPTMWNNNPRQHWGAQQHPASVLYPNTSGQRLIHSMSRVPSGSLNVSPQMHRMPENATSIPNRMPWPVGNYSMPQYQHQHGQESNNPSGNVPPELSRNMNQLYRTD